MQRSAICSHCSRVGSMPVGLCAQPADQINVLRYADSADSLFTALAACQ